MRPKVILPESGDELVVALAIGRTLKKGGYNYKQFYTELIDAKDVDEQVEVVKRWVKIEFTNEGKKKE